MKVGPAILFSALISTTKFLISLKRMKFKPESFCGVNAGKRKSPGTNFGTLKISDLYFTFSAFAFIFIVTLFPLVPALTLVSIPNALYVCGAPMVRSDLHTKCIKKTR